MEIGDYLGEQENIKIKIPNLMVMEIEDLC